MRELLEGLVTRGVIVALASWNKPEYVTQALHLFNIHQYFQFIEAQFHPNKHLMIREILRKLERKGVKPRPRQILYGDDRTRHLADIRKEIGNVLFLQMHVDIKNPLDVLKYLNKP